MNNDNEFGNIAFDLPKNQSNVIKVIGVGGGGSNAINHMFQQGIKGVDFVICNTDAQALQNSGVPNKIQLGVNLTEGLGAGANPEVGEQSAIESLDDLKRMLETNTKMVFITAGMGGGTGTGAAPIIAKLAMELNILTVGIVTIPFQFEGRMRNEQAQKGIEKLRENVDSLIVINNNKLREVYGNLGFKAGFSKADEVLATASRGIAEVITHHYTQNIDLRDAKTVLSKSGTAIMGSATASGQTRAQEAIMKALDSPLLNDNKITGAKNVLLLIVSGTDEITLDEIGEINDHIQNEAGYSANIIMGVGEDQSLEDSIAVTIIATGFNMDQQNEISNTETKKVVHNLSDEPVNKTPIKPKENSVDASKVVKHTLEDDTTNATSKNITSQHQNIVPTTDDIKNIDVVYDNVESANLMEDTQDEFIITPVTTDDFVETNPSKDKTDNEEQITLTFDLPIDNVKQPENTVNDAPMMFQLDDDVKAIKVNEHTEVIAEEVTETIEKRYVLDVDSEDEKESTTNTNSKTVVAEEKEDIVFEKKIISNNDNDTNTEKETQLDKIDPIHSPISEMLKARTNERKRTMKEFNYKFNTSKIDDIEKEPAYKRQGVDLEETQHSSDSNTSKLSVSTDDNDEVQLRKGNSFLYDNVD